MKIKLNKLSALFISAMLITACGSSDDASKNAEVCKTFETKVTNSGLATLVSAFNENWEFLEGSMEGAEAAWELGAVMETLGTAAETASSMASGEAKDLFADLSISLTDAGTYVALKGGSVDSLLVSNFNQVSGDFDAISNLCGKS
jgi:hypothetical protein